MVTAGCVRSYKRAYRAPITPISAVSNETMPEGPMFGVATGVFPPAFWRLVSAIVALMPLEDSFLKLGDFNLVQFEDASTTLRC